MLCLIIVKPCANTKLVFCTWLVSSQPALGHQCAGKQMLAYASGTTSVVIVFTVYLVNNKFLGILLVLFALFDVNT